MILIHLVKKTILCLKLGWLLHMMLTQNNKSLQTHHLGNKNDNI